MTTAEKQTENIIQGTKDLSLGKEASVFEINLGSIILEYSLFSIPQFYIGKNIIHLPTFKTHGHTGAKGGDFDGS